MPSDKRKLQLQLAEKYAREQLEAGRRYGDPEAVRQVKRASQLPDKECRQVLRDVAARMQREGGAG